MIVEVKMVLEINPKDSSGSQHYAGVKEQLYKRVAGILDADMKSAINAYGFRLDDLEIVVSKDTRKSDTDNAQAISDSL